MHMSKFSHKRIGMAVGVLALAIGFSNVAFSTQVPIEIIMKNNGYHFSHGGMSGGLMPGFTLTAGETTEITLRNEDTTPHDFVSEIFNSMDVAVVGEATSVNTMGASGFRVYPGKSVKLRFTPRAGEDFKGSYDVFWCSIHGKPNMRGEVIVVDTRTGTGAF